MGFFVCHTCGSMINSLAYGYLLAAGIDVVTKVD